MRLLYYWIKMTTQTEQPEALAITCPKCGNASKRFGRHRNGLQRFRCLACRKTFTEDHEPSFRVEDYLKDPRGLMAIRMLVEGCSIRSVERMTGIRAASLVDLLLIAGKRCERLLESRIRNVEVSDVQADEAWSFIQVKEAHKRPEQAHDDTIGDCYTWICIDRASKLVLAHVVGRRTRQYAYELMYKLRKATSPARRFQLSTDGLQSYIPAVDEMVSDRCDYGQLIKIYAAPREGEQRYSPAEVVEAVPVVISGNPDKSRICTSHVERFNLTLRMTIRRFTRLTNAFSKKLDSHKAAVALCVAYYNWCRIHQSLRVTPAMEAGITDHVWNLDELLA